MKAIINNISRVVKREINRMTSRSLYILVALVFPVLSTLFFASLFKEGVPTQMPIAIVDLDQTAASRRIARNIEVTPVSRVTENLLSETEAMSELRSGNIYGFVVIPKNLQADILSSRQPVISYYYQNSFLNSGGLIRNNLATVLRTLSAGISIQKREAMGQQKNYALQQVQPIQLNVHLLFNPTSNYTTYVSSIAMPVMLQLFILLITVYSIGIEIKEKTSHEWLQFADKSVIAAITGKLIPYTVIFFIVMMFQNFILYKVMQVPMNCGIGWLMLASLLMILAYQAIGILCIGLFPVMRHALNMAAFYGILALSLTGFSFPVGSMLPVAQSWATLFPARQYMHIYHSQVLAGFELRYCIVSYLFLLMYLLLPVTIINRLKSALIYQNFIETIHKT